MADVTAISVRDSRQNETHLQGLVGCCSSIEENKERGNWSGRFDFFFSCLGYAVGLGNVWRFPYLAYRHGGSAFFIPYCIFLVVVGIPMFFLELSLGQYTSNGPVTCWKFAPIFTGIGYGMVAVSALVAIYYNILIAWAIYYLFSSFSLELPWATCTGQSWASELCWDNVFVTTDSEDCTSRGWTTNSATGICTLNGTIKGMFDVSLAYSSGFRRTLPSKDYFEQVAIGHGKSSGIDDLGPMNWKLVLCYMAGFVIVVIALSRSIKTSGKVVYFTATFPYVVLIILLNEGLKLHGSKDGIDFYLTPNLSKLSDFQVWKDAAIQVFFSLSVSWGGLITLSSYNRFHTDCLTHAVVVAFGNCLTSFFAGFVIFSYLGNLAHELNLPFDEVADSGPSLAFVVYPYALSLTKMPQERIWTILFFLMLITLGVDSEFVLVETILTSLYDKVPKLREYKFLTVTGICSIFFLLGLTLTTNGGIYMLTVMDDFSGGWNVMIIACLECISIGYFYGVRRFMDDIETMIGHKLCGLIPFPWFVVKWWWALCWCFLTPMTLLAVMIYSWVKYQGYTYRRDKFPEWADALGWMMTSFVLVTIALVTIIMVCIAPDKGRGKYYWLFNPTKEWGPYLVKHRREAKKYITKWSPFFEVDPLRIEELQDVNGASVNDVHITMSATSNEAFDNERIRQMTFLDTFPGGNR